MKIGAEPRIPMNGDFLLVFTKAEFHLASSASISLLESRKSATTERAASLVSESRYGSHVTISRRQFLMRHWVTRFPASPLDFLVPY